VFNDIIAALESHLLQFAEEQNMETAWRGHKFEPSGDRYLRGVFLPSDTVQASLGDSGMDAISGIYQVDVFAHKELGRLLTTDDIADHFRRGLSLTEGKAVVRLRTASIGLTLYEDVWSVTPVSISWDCYLEAR